MNLDDVFLIDGGGNLPPRTDEIELDEVNSLDTVIRLSLEAYKSMMDDISFIEVKNRVKHLEVADKYLKTATDAMYKKESIITARARVQKPNNSPTDDVPVSGESISRDELYEKRRQKLNRA